MCNRGDLRRTTWPGETFALDLTNDLMMQQNVQKLMQQALPSPTLHSQGQTATKFERQMSKHDSTDHEINTDWPSANLHCTLAVSDSIFAGMVEQARITSGSMAAKTNLKFVEALDTVSNINNFLCIIDKIILKKKKKLTKLMNFVENTFHSSNNG